jgi:hypothetical protein
MGDIILLMSCTDKASFVSRGGKVYSIIQAMLEKLFESFGIRREGVFKVLNRGFAKK